ncbi:Protein of unknown function DUF4128 [uncultured Caudovirales phage]|uniref:Tail completion protein n=1 Tax=uncultured Caudovirales phage TaxID=2100421 RepID=A0A6J5LBQ1_9CAUD|nr:Protein of unknown function DUF4128 [uncultured Caudovirales phage]
MSNLAIRQGLEVKLASVLPPLSTAWENDPFEPQADVPYQEAYLLFAKPENPTMGDGFYRQRGILQITLRYPLNAGPKDVGERAELLRETFHRGLSVVANGVRTTIDETPEVPGGSIVGDRYVIVMRVRFYADLFRE